MLSLRKVAVTGGLSAGKTTVCKIFKELGAYVVSADEIVHQLLSPGTSTAEQIVRLLGSDITNGNELDRKKIADKVFSQPDLLNSLEKIIHPAVFDEIERRYEQASQEKKYPLFVAEIPLLYEAAEENNEVEEKFDSIISVTALTDLCRQRFVKQTKNPVQEFDKRLGRQIAPEQKAEKAHYKIENNGTLEQLRDNVKTLYSKLTKE